MSFTDHLWNRISPTYEAILEHPFIQELTRGTLSEEVFRFYMQQDALYLSDFSRALAAVGTQSHDASDMEQFFEFATNALVAERNLHEELYEEIDSDMKIQKSPTCAAYTNFIVATAFTKNRCIAIAALLPCFWIYREVGSHIIEHSAPENPYQDWIDMYGGQDFQERVQQAIDTTEQVAARQPEAQKEAMTEAFVRASQLEWMFWDSAYHQEEWPQQAAYTRSTLDETVTAE